MRSVAVNGSVSALSIQVTPSKEYIIPFVPPSATNLPLPHTMSVTAAKLAGAVAPVQVMPSVE